MCVSKKCIIVLVDKEIRHSTIFYKSISATTYVKTAMHVPFLPYFN